MTSTHESLATDWTRLAERGTGRALRAGVWVYRRLGSRMFNFYDVPGVRAA